MKKIIAGTLAAFIIITPTITFAQAVPNIAELQAQIEALLEQVRALQAQLGAAQGTSPEWCYVFTRNLQLGDRGDDVAALHRALSRFGFTVSPDAAQFTEETASAISGLQQKYAGEILSPLGLRFGTGFFGTLTRTKLNDLVACGKPGVWLPPRAQSSGPTQSYPPYTLSTSRPSYPTSVTPAHRLVGHWDFNEGRGSVAHDSGNGDYDLLVREGGPYGEETPGEWNSRGYEGGALVFDGDGEYAAALSDSSAFNMAGPMTAMAWVYLEEYPGSNRAILHKQVGGEGGYAMHIMADGSPEFDIHSTNWLTADAVGSEPLSLRRWHHLAGVFDGSTLALFVDGENVALVAAPYGLSPSSDVFKVGMSIPGYWFEGLIDDVRLYSWALEAGEIKIIAEGGDIGLPPEPNPDVEASERVRCRFADSTSEEKCYTYVPSAELGSPEDVSCAGVESCVVEVTGRKWADLTWGSSCGGSAHTTLDGDNEYVYFDCSDEVAGY